MYDDYDNTNVLIHPTPTGGELIDGEFKESKFKLNSNAFYYKNRSGRYVDGSYNYPLLYDYNWMLKTWFFSHDQYENKELDFWQNIIIFPNNFPMNTINSGFMGNRWFYHNQLGWVYVASISANGIWVFISKNVSSVNKSLNYCWFGRKFIFSKAGTYSWQGLVENMTSSSVSLMRSDKASFTEGQCVLFYSVLYGDWCSMIVNSLSRIFVAPISGGLLNYKLLV
jgi:hypothetical protein